MNQAIVTALLALDVNNDDHWTSDGLPRMDAVEALVGDKAITRQQVTAARPGFSRAIAAAQAQAAQAAAPVPVPTPTPTPVVQTAPAAPPAAPAPTPAPPVPVVDEGDGDEGDTNDEDGDDGLRALLATAQAKLQELDKARAVAEGAYRMQMAEVDRLSDRLEAVVGRETTTDAIQGYLARQRQNLAERAERMQALSASGVDLQALTRGLKTPLDSAMARNTKRGTQRPGGAVANETVGT